MNDHSLGLILSCYAIYEKPYSDEIQSVLNQVSSYFGKHVSYLFVKDRKPQRIYMRQLAIYLLVDGGYSQTDIARVFDVSQQAICSHFKTINGFLKVDADVKNDLVKIRA